MLLEGCHEDTAAATNQTFNDNHRLWQPYQSLNFINPSFHASPSGLIQWQCPLDIFIP